jgi:stage II sporulation protein AA (anti-sigma F factor antagonist)
VQPFLVSVEEKAPGRFAVILSGEIDLAVIAQLEAHLLPMITRDAFVAADLSRVSFMDSSGLHLLSRITKLAEANGARFRLCAPSPEVQRVFDLVGAELFLEILADLHTALNED